MEAEPFVVMAKPVGSRCNMQCSYCYYLEKGQYSAHRKQGKLSIDLLEKMIRQTIACSEGPVVSFTWHGGEPMLAGQEYYEKILAIEKKYMPENWQVWNNLQTNGTLLNDKWAKFLKENRFDVGVSIDGSAEIHDRNRRDRGGKGTWAKTKAGIEALQRNGIQPDLLCTVNAVSAEDPVAVYRTLRDLGTGWMQFIPIVVRFPDGSFSAESITPEAYGEFLCRVYDEWIRNDLGKVDVQLFAETARVWAGGSASLCWMSPTCGRVLVVEEDGAVYSCDHFVDPVHRLGTLENDDLGTMADSPFQLTFGHQKQVALTAECRACPWLSCCNGGCLKDRFACSADGEPGQYYLCRGLKRFWEHAHPSLHRAMELSREGKTPDAIMEQLKTEFYA